MSLMLVVAAKLGCLSPPRSTLAEAVDSGRPAEAAAPMDGPVDARPDDAAPPPDILDDSVGDIVVYDVAAPPRLLLDSRAVLDPRRTAGRPAEAYPEFTSDGAWCWFADPRALRHQGVFDRTYLGWVTSAGEVAIGAYDQQTRTTIISLVKTLGADDHDSPALLVLPSGRIAVFYCHHSGSKLYYRVTKAPEDITAWGPERTVPGNSAGNHGYTYPNPISLAGEADRIYLFWRGGGWLPTVSTSETGVNWSPPKVFIETGKSRPYVKYASDNKDRIHFAFTDGHPANVEDNNIYHAYYEKGSFHRADGTPIGALDDDVPLSPAVVDKVYDTASGNGRAWVWDIGLDGGGAPVIVYATFPSEDDHRYHYARWTGSVWESRLLASAGATLANAAEPYYSGGIVLDAEDTNTVYLARMTATVYELERWSYEPVTGTWFWTPITNSSSWENIRPVSVRNHGHGPMQLLWMHGEYEYYDQQYDTSLKVFPGE